MSVESSREFYQRFLTSESDKFGGWQTLKRMLLKETALSRGARLSARNEEHLLRMLISRQFVQKVLAAEIFPDRHPKEIIVAMSQTENHDPLRERFPSNDSRVSGDVVFWEEVKFFMLDGFMVETDSYYLEHVKSSRNDILNFLLDQGYIPVDPFFNIVPFSK